ncbi:MAG TPA: sulfite exporter TauE/SafE family protein [Vicinamibacterales bacterium]
MTSLHYAALAAITFGAAFVNGALGYGFSSLTVPLALLFLSNRTLTPALVLLEVVLNAYVLWVNRSALPQVRRRVLPVTIGLAPGVIVGTFIVSTVSPDWLKFWTYVALLPLILIQTIGYRRPIRAERAAGLLFGGGVGVLYAVTTISGPPLAVALNNQGFSKQEFRAALGLVRLAESTMTAVAYLVTGLFIRDSIALLPWIVPSVAIGVPLGTLSIRHLDAETFRRVSMSFDAWIVSFGVSVLLRQLHLVDGNAAFSVMAIVVAIDAWLLRRFFRSRPG